MAYVFKKHKMIDGRKYGPTANGWYYQPAAYHPKVTKSKNKKGHKAKESEHEDKSSWILDKSQQYDVFLEGVKGNFMDSKNMFSVLDNCNVVMGIDDERIALFPVPPSGTVDWHGYPISSKEEKLTSEIMDLFFKAKVINFTIYSRMLRRDL
jgi:hypothetical protein